MEFYKFKNKNMWKKIIGLTTPLMVIVVSVISILLLQNHVLAQWADPTVQPSEDDSRVFFNPAVENLDLNGNAIIDSSAPSFIIEPGGSTGLRVGGSDYAGYFDGDVNINGNLSVWGKIIDDGSDWFSELSDTPGTANTSTAYNGYSGYIVQVNQTEDGLEFASLVLPTGLWSQSGANIYRNSKVGIGTTTPSSLLSIQSNPGSDAEIAIQSGTNEAWLIYNEESSNDLRFWHPNVGDVLSLTESGGLLLGTTTQQEKLTVDGSGFFTSDGAITLEVLNTGTNKTGIFGSGFEGVKGYSDIASGAGVYGIATSPLTSSGVYGFGYYGVYGESNASSSDSTGIYGISGTGKYGGYFSSDESNGAGAYGTTAAGEAGVWGVGTAAANYGVRGDGKYGVAGYPTVAGGAGIYGEGSATSDAAYFEGNLVIEAYGSTDSFLQLDTISGTPAAGDCTSSYYGRMIYDTSNNKLWVCSNGWKSTTLAP